jgi:hypothetical protein
MNKIQDELVQSGRVFALSLGVDSMKQTTQYKKRILAFTMEKWVEKEPKIMGKIKREKQKGKLVRSGEKVKRNFEGRGENTGESQ